MEETIRHNLKRPEVKPRPLRKNAAKKPEPVCDYWYADISKIEMKFVSSRAEYCGVYGYGVEEYIVMYWTLDVTVEYS